MLLKIFYILPLRSLQKFIKILSNAPLAFFVGLKRYHYQPFGFFEGRR